MNTSPGGLYSVLKVGAVTFGGAFFGALTVSGGIPTTLSEAKAVVLPALGAAVVAEVYYLRSEFSKLVAAQGQAQAPSPPAPKAAS